MYLTDTHTHLYSSEFDNDRNEMMDRAIMSGINKFFLPNIDSASIPSLFALVKQYPANCFPMMGVHPCSVDQHFEEELRVVEHWLEKKNSVPVAGEKFYAVGEIGIDLYWDKTFYVQQHYAFKMQMELAKKYDLPVVIHTRNAFEEVYDLVSKLKDEKLRGIFHCFSGNLEQANKIIALGGFKLGIGGVVTFKNSGLDKILKEIDMEHIVLETDSPYLAPTPHRGARNESSYIPYIAQKVAEIKGMTIEEVARVTNENVLTIFGV